MGATWTRSPRDRVFVAGRCRRGARCWGRRVHVGCGGSAGVKRSLLLGCARVMGAHSLGILFAGRGSGCSDGTPCSFLKPSGGSATKVKVHFQRFQASLRVTDSKSASWRAVCDILTSKQTLKKKNYSHLIVLGYGAQFFLITLEFSSLTTFGDVWRSCTVLS